MFVRAFLLFIAKPPAQSRPAHSSPREAAPVIGGQTHRAPAGLLHWVQPVGGVWAAGRQILPRSVQLQVQQQGILAGDRGPGGSAGINDGATQTQDGMD